MLLLEFYLKNPTPPERTFRNHGFTFDKIPVPPPPFVHAPRAFSPHYHLSNSTIQVTISETHSFSALGSCGRFDLTSDPVLSLGGMLTQSHILPCWMGEGVRRSPAHASRTIALNLEKG